METIGTGITRSYIEDYTKDIKEVQISLEQLKDKFSTMGKESVIKSNNTGIIMIWFAILGKFDVFCCRNDRNMEAEKAYEVIN